jgi:hypothetical protein
LVRLFLYLHQSVAAPNEALKASGASANEVEHLIAMNDNTTAELDQADEEILTFTVSDDALEAATGAEKAMASASTISFGSYPYHCCE